jgi:hypothetical protein
MKTNKLFIYFIVILSFFFINFIFTNNIQAAYTDQMSCMAAGGEWDAISGTCNIVDLTAAGNSSGNTADGLPLQDPLGLDQSHPIGSMANRLITTALGISGVLALLAFIYGGILWMVPFGDQTGNIRKGKQMMVWAILGLVVIFGSYAVINFISTALGITQ